MLNSLLATGASPGPSFLTSLVPLLIIVAIFWFLMWRPMKQRQRSHEALVAGLKNGDKVITTGGIHGVIAGVRENTVLVKVSDKVKLEVAKTSIASLQAEGSTPDA